MISCDHLGTEIYDSAEYSDGGGNDLGNWCCPGDITEDGTVDDDDLLDLIDDWALSSDGDNRSDYDRDEDVDVVDLIGMLSNWGECED